MIFQRINQFRIEIIATSGGPECPITHIASGATSNLSEFGRCQPAVTAAVEFAGGRKGDMIDIKVQPHTDGICGYQIIDLARLV